MRWLVLASGLVLAISGAALAFALQPGRPPNWTALGLIILVSGVAVLTALGAVAGRSLFPSQVEVTGEDEKRCSGSRPAPQSDRALGGLLAVVSGILAVVIVGVVTLALLGNADTSSTVAVATSAFGVISTVVGAYLGVKIGAEQTQAATRTAEAAVNEATKTAGRAADAAREAKDAAGGAAKEAREAKETAGGAASEAREAKDAATNGEAGGTGASGPSSPSETPR